MKKIIASIIVLFALVGCVKEEDIAIDPAYEKADITAIQCYNKTGASAVASSQIAIPSRSAIVILKKGEDITQLKMSLSVSPGATVDESIPIGYADYTNPRTVVVTSPGSSQTRQWTIKIYPSY